MSKPPTPPVRVLEKYIVSSSEDRSARSSSALVLSEVSAMGVPKSAIGSHRGGLDPSRTSASSFGLPLTPPHALIQLSPILTDNARCIVIMPYGYHNFRLPVISSNILTWQSGRFTPEHEA